MLTHALVILCGLGAATFGAVSAARRWVVGACFAGAFALSGLWMGFDRIPNVALIGWFVVTVVALQLARPGFFPLSAACSGILSAVCVPVLRQQGIDPVSAMVLALSIPGASMLLAIRRPMFAPLPMFEKGLLLVLALALIVAAGPAVQSGWRFATVMNLPYTAARSMAPASWVFWVGTSASALGGCYTFWWRTR